MHTCILLSHELGSQQELSEANVFPVMLQPQQALVMQSLIFMVAAVTWKHVVSAPDLLHQLL
jgi:hypothetical protein